MPWRFPDPNTADADGIVGIGADLEPDTLLDAYAAGIFPMPLSEIDAMVWWSPDPRAIVPVEAFRPGRSLRRSMRGFTVTFDRAFAEVVDGCASPSRPGGWITPEIRRAYVRLHELGHAHSVEAYDEDGRLAGGLYGVELGGLFAAESKFHRRTDASKVALAALVGRLAGAGGERMLDVQWSTPHLASLGAVEIPRAEYLSRLGRVLVTRRTIGA